ncbi:ABC transporter substrate-binding protein [Microbispora sp. CA-102843]|uniref:ABC transporter substrate-binding protein n=1 Tax=Microbispora sp. CA-102843 TaxID=3239952 RepID=UPI003D8A3280
MSPHPRWRRLVASAALIPILAGAASCGTGIEQAPQGAQAKRQITFWHYFTDRKDLFEQWAKEYEKQTGVAVKVVMSDGGSYAQKFQAATQAGTLPDVMIGWSQPGEKLAPYAKQGTILNLSDEMNRDGWKDRFYPTALTNASFGPDNEWGVQPGPYGVPLDVNNIQFLYNKDLFAKAGITAPPRTFDELLDTGTRLKDAGIVPFTSGFGAWAIGSLAQIYYWNLIGQEDLEKSFSGELPYSGPQWLGVLKLLKRLGGSGILADGVVSFDMPAAESMFVSGKAAMLLDGSWAVNVFAQQNPGFTNYGVFPPPTAGTHPVKLPGGVTTLMVIGTSPNKDEALKFARWVTDTPQQAKYSETSFNLPAHREVGDGQIRNAQLAEFAKGNESLAPQLRVSMPPAVATTLTKGLQQLLVGKETPEHLASLMDKAQKSGQAQ